MFYLTVQAFRAACAADILMINCTQCLRGFVTDAYQTGRVLAQAGILPGCVACRITCSLRPRPNSSYTRQQTGS